MSKSLRLLSVWQIVERRKVVTPKDVLTEVAHRNQEDPESAGLKRSVYRDLKELADSGKIGVRLLSSDGAEVSPDEWEELKGGRIEYYSSQADPKLDVLGIQLLREAGGDFIPPSRNLGWQIKKFTELGEGVMSLVFKGVRGNVVSLQLPIDMLPARVLITRADEDKSSYKILAEEAIEQLGPRTSCFFSWHNSVSRSQFQRRLGHAYLTLSKDGRVVLKDLSSTSGTFFSSIEPHLLEDFLDFLKMDKTSSLEGDLLETDRVWTPVTEQGSALNSPSLIKFGTFTMLMVF